ncbi:MAG: efflux RND transporter periplasmic adaptor subunit [Rubrivivax sp.]|nr:efflux RND transporter periplasmic adaptor subunit [Rubrivivax sp.]
MNRWIASSALFVALTAIGSGLAAWKFSTFQQAQAAAASHPEMAETVRVALAEARAHRQASTTIGTVLATRSVTLRNELAGTVRHVALRPGEIVEAGTVLVALDVSVEHADLQAQRAQLALATATLARLQRLREFNATSEIEVDRARAERDVAQAQIARTEAVIERKTIRVPFRARVGLADVHPGQYLNEGTELTTLQGVDDALHVDFSVPQAVAAGLRKGDRVEVQASAGAPPITARVTAVDARVDPATRASLVRARIDRGAQAPAPGSSVRVSVAVGAPQPAVAVPASALRKGPTGDHVFVLAEDKDRRTRVHLRAVQVGATLGDEVLVVDGLAPGEQVAASGSFKLRDAMLVAVAAGSGKTAQARPAATGS